MNTSKNDLKTGVLVLILISVVIYLAVFVGIYKFKNDLIGKAVERACREDWTCEEWSPCEAGYQFRTCMDLDNCYTELKKPVEMMKCSVDSITKSGMSIRSNFEVQTGISLTAVILFGVLILILSSLAATLIAKEISAGEIKKEQDKERIENLTMTRLANYIQREINCGYTKNQITEKLTSEGWNRHSIDDAFARVDLLKKEPIMLENRWKMDLSKKIEEEFRSYSKK